MKISEVLAISGKPGLFKVLASSAKNLVVESMLDGKRTSVPGSIRVSSLNDITMYTLKDDVPLKEILLKMHQKSKGAEAPSHNSTPQEIKDFVDSVITNLDHDRVYSSDLRKLVQWYNILIDQKALPFDPEDPKESEDGEEKDAAKDKSTTAKKKPEAKKKHVAHKPVAKKRASAKGATSKAGGNKATKKG
ncbi:MAG: DUF5606 domain-containing protein [Bacteroidetes bacterium]|jgi:hypothetical protein|nr:DUF5606 domain-containing protein [Bacteroidota bacterium]MDA1382401.1 DUF5606 domain-containing protein [Bacteroidota bacterium]